MLSYHLYNGMRIWSNIELGYKVWWGILYQFFKGGGELLREDLYFLFLLFLIIRFTLWEESIQYVQGMEYICVRSCHFLVQEYKKSFGLFFASDICCVYTVLASIPTY